MDEQAGILMKFGMPVLSIRRIEAGLSLSHHDGYLLNVPGSVPTNFINDYNDAIKAGMPLLLIGRADLVLPLLLVPLGLASTSNPNPANLYESRITDASIVPDVNATQTIFLPEFSTMQVISAKSYLDVIGKDSRTSILAGKNNALWWQPLDWKFPALTDLSTANIGSVAPHYLIQAIFNNANPQQKVMFIQSGVNWTHPVAVHSWKSSGKLKILLGNLETDYTDPEPALKGYSTTPRLVEVVIQPGIISKDVTRDCWEMMPFDTPHPEIGIRGTKLSNFRDFNGPQFLFTFSLGPKGSIVYELNSC